MASTATHPAAHSKATRRGLILHDAAVFVALLAVSIALFGVTLFLFRSFEQHRIDLARRWSEHGENALKHGKPEEAVVALRAALSYTPDGSESHHEQLMLAQALAGAGHADEATNYYLNLWEAHPGDGLINLQLARLARVRHDDAEATDYYRAAVYGSWEGDAVPRRREVRLELTDFLIAQHRNAEARNELFVIAGNTPGDAQLALLVAEKLESAGYTADAISFYSKAVQNDPHSRTPLVRAGEAAYRLGEYPQAVGFLRRAMAERPTPGEPAGEESHILALAGNAERIQQLSLASSLSPHERALHLATDERVAENRLRACLASTAPSSDLTDVLARWTALESGPKPGSRPATKASRRALLEDPSDQDTFTHLIYETEQVTASSCGAPTGDDALLLQLANVAEPRAAASAPAPAVLPARPPIVPGLNGLFGRKEPAAHGK
jgi:tetratricopeptide (TPR) repeat protein